MARDNDDELDIEIEDDLNEDDRKALLAFAESDDDKPSESVVVGANEAPAPREAKIEASKAPVTETAAQINIPTPQGAITATELLPPPAPTMRTQDPAQAPAAPVIAGSQMIPQLAPNQPTAAATMQQAANAPQIMGSSVLQK